MLSVMGANGKFFRGAASLQVQDARRVFQGGLTMALVSADFQSETIGTITFNNDQQAQRLERGFHP